MLISHNVPSLTASIGRIARYRSSLTRAASSTSSSDTAENPRTVASFPGSPTIRDPFGNTSEISLSPSPFGRIPSRRANSRRLPHKLPALPRARTHHQRQALRLRRTPGAPPSPP